MASQEGTTGYQAARANLKRPALQTSSAANPPGLAARVSELAQGTRAKATAISSPVVERVLAVVGAARDVKTAGVNRITSLRAALAATYADARNKGLRTWSLEISRIAGEITGVKIREIKKLSSAALTNTRISVEAKASDAKVRAQELAAATQTFASKKSVQTTAASAVGGAAVMGAGGAATGAVTGGLAGAAAGLPFALFTFGLSIPIGAAMGGVSGAVVGTAAGTTAGALGGGAAGYGGYQYRSEIRGAAEAVGAKANNGAAFVKGTAQKSADYAKEVAASTRARLVRASTGSTD